MHKSNVYHRIVIIVLLFLITLFCCPDPAGTQGISSRISGVITDEDTNQPVPYVNVLLANITMGASTDAKGSYLISDIPVSKVPCVFSTLPRKNSDEYFKLHQGTVQSLIMGFGEYITAEQISLFPEVNSPFLQLYFDEAIRVTFSTPHPNNQSIIELTSEHALIDSLGNLLTPLTITVHGRWSGKRIADTLPFDYHPEIYLKTEKIDKL